MRKSLVIFFVLAVVNLAVADDSSDPPSSTDGFLSFLEVLEKDMEKEFEARLNSSRRRRQIFDGDALSTDSTTETTTDSSDSTTTDSDSTTTTTDDDTTTTDSYPTAETTETTTDDSSSTTDDSSSTSGIIVETHGMIVETNGMIVETVGRSNIGPKCFKANLRISELFPFLEFSENVSAIRRIVGRWGLKYGEDLQRISEQQLESAFKLHVNDSQVDCVIQCENEGLREAAKQNETCGYVKCSYFEKAQSCLASKCQSSEKNYAKLAANSFGEITSHYCSAHGKSTFNNTNFAECLKKFSVSEPNCANWLSYLDKFANAKTVEEKCEVLSRNFIGDILHEADTFCEFSQNANFLRPLIVLELAQLSDGHLIEKCPQLYKSSVSFA